MNKTQLRRVEQGELELWEQGPIADKLPVKWDDTEFELNEFVPECSECRQEILNPYSVCGTVERINDAVVIVRAAAHCMECDVLTIHIVRIRSSLEDGTFMQKMDGNGQWQFSHFRHKHPIKAFFQSLRRLVWRKRGGRSVVQTKA